MSNELADIAALNGFSHSAARAAFDALCHGGGMAQFNHAELGGYGQWMNGMVMIGSMNEHALKARVAALFADLLPWARERFLQENTMQPMMPMATSYMDAPQDWGDPASSGGQNNIRYAYFPRPSRLIVERDGKRTIYDTADHRITGVSQDQSNLQTGRLVFTSQQGPVALDSLKLVESAPPKL